MKDLKDVLTEVVQIGIITDDLEKVKTVMKRDFGVEPIAAKAGVFPPKQFPIANPKYHGERSEYTAEIAHYDFGIVELEFIHPLAGGPNIWKDFLDKHGPGVHHIMFNAKNFEEADQCFKDHGYEPVQFGDTIRGKEQPFAYYDLPELGFCLEMLSGRHLQLPKSENT